MLSGGFLFGIVEFSCKGYGLLKFMLTVLKRGEKRGGGGHGGFKEGKISPIYMVTGIP